MHHTATYCNTLQHTATHYNTLQHPETHCNTLQHTFTIVARVQMLLRNVRFGLAHTVTRCNTLPYTATAVARLRLLLCHVRSGVEHTATHCKTLQHTATPCNTLQKLLQECCCSCPYVTWLICVLHDSFAPEMMDFGFSIFSIFFEYRVPSWIAEIYQIFRYYNIWNAQRIELPCYWSTGGRLALNFLFHFVSSYFEKLPCGAAGGADLQSWDSVIHI